MRQPFDIGGAGLYWAARLFKGGSRKLSRQQDNNAVFTTGIQALHQMMDERKARKEAKRAGVEFADLNLDDDDLIVQVYFLNDEETK
jgi:hypothetical protein